MKKLLFVTSLLFSFLLISCGSTPKSDSINKDEIIPLETEQDEKQDQTNSSTEKSNNEALNKEDQTNNFSDEIQELEDIEEPDIFDLPYEEETINKQFKNELNITENQENKEEQITEADYLPPTIQNAETVEVPPELPEITVTSEAPSQDLADETQLAETQSDELSLSDTTDFNEQDSDIDLEEDNEQDFPTEEIIIPSRSVTLNKSEYLDIQYPGTGWIYMGTTDNSTDVISNPRRTLGTADTKYSLLAKNSGTKILHFYRNDPLSKEITDDYIQVTVNTKKGSPKTHIQAPAYVPPLVAPAKKVEPKPLENLEENEESLAATNSETTTNNEVSQDTQLTKEAPKPVEAAKNQQKATPKKAVQKQPKQSDEDEVELLEEAATDETTVVNLTETLSQAKELFKNHKMEQALEAINNYLNNSNDSSDEALFIKAQILESSEISDISQAIETYRLLTDNYPASKYWDKANKRIIYLNRFYFEGR